MKKKGWALFEREEITSLTTSSDVYLTRWRLLQSPYCALYLHRIHRPDEDRDLHDHPWPFVSLILRNGYTEERETGEDERPLRKLRLPGTLNIMGRYQAHRISQFVNPDRPVWSLVLRGRVSRDWGYVTSDGWVRHDEYHKRRAQNG